MKQSQLEALVAIADAGSFHQAARRCGVFRSTLRAARSARGVRRTFHLRVMAADAVGIALVPNLVSNRSRTAPPRREPPLHRERTCPWPR